MKSTNHQSPRNKMNLLLVASLILVALYVGLYLYARSLITPYTLNTHIFEKVGTHQPAFVTIFDKPTLKLSIIAPAYNEQDRVCGMLDETLQYCEERHKSDKSFTFEIIVVNDGSKDKTEQVVKQYIEKNDQGRDVLRFISLKQNRGKGYAVKQGVLKSRGEYVLFADSDAATDIRDLVKLEKNITDIAIGSRAHMKESNVQRNFFRNIVSNMSHYLTRYVAGIYVAKDTQCGFKLFKRDIAKVLFTNLNSDRWVFDIDLLHMSQKLGYQVSEVAVNWMEKEGSKLTVWGMATTARDLLLVRLYYAFGFWTIDPNPKPNL
jgi:dolichyl-phosphate beta-glucosyltransferase